MNKSFMISVILLILLGSILRFSFFWQPSFTGDEAGHMMKAVSVSKGLTDFLLNHERAIALRNIFLPILQHNHPPLEFLVLIPAVPFHPREFSARLIYVLISILTLSFGGLILKKIIGKSAAIAYLALFSTSIYLIWFSQTITFGLNLTGGVFIAVGLLMFVNRPSVNSLIILVASVVFSLLVSVDFILFLPAVILALWKNRVCLTTQCFYVIAGGIILLTVFYVPYISYSFLPNSPKGAGFIHYQSYLTASRATQVGSHFEKGFKSFLNEKWQQFFARPGVWTIWPWALVTLLPLKRKRRTYEFYLWFILLIILLLEVPAVPCCTVYLNLFGPLILLAAEGIVLLPRFSTLIITLTILIQLIQGIPILQGKPNPILFNNWQKKTDKIIEVGSIVKPCITNEQSYISTEDAWRTRYYFGRPMLPTVEYEVITREEAVKQFLQGDLQNQIAVIHVHTSQINDDLLVQLKSRAKYYREIGSHKIYFFKDCRI